MAMFRRSLSNEARGGGRGGAAGEELRGERRIGLRFCVFSLTKSQGDDQTGGVKGYPPLSSARCSVPHSCVCVCDKRGDREGMEGERGGGMVSA